MGAECIENTCDTLAEPGSLPDQIRVRPRWYRFSPFRRRQSPTPQADGTPYFEDCGVDLLLVGDDVEDDQLAPSIGAAAVDAFGNLGRNGLSRRTLPGGQIALFAEPAPAHSTLSNSSAAVSGLTGSIGSAGNQVQLGTVSLSLAAGAFPILVRPIVVVSDLRLGYVTEVEVIATEDVTHRYLPAVSYRLAASGDVVTANGTATALDFTATIGTGGVYRPTPFTIPARGQAQMEVRGGLIYDDDIPATFPIVSGGQLRLDWELIEQTGTT